jgi:hypothetical protein
MVALLVLVACEPEEIIKEVEVIVTQIVEKEVIVTEIVEIEGEQVEVTRSRGHAYPGTDRSHGRLARHGSFR